MKKNLIFCFLLILIGCSEETLDINFRESIPVDGINQDDVVPIEKAIKGLYLMMDAMPVKTRSGCTRQIEAISVCGGNSITRSNGYSLSDTVAYVVNFADNQGFAVLGARYSLEPLYALTEKGTLDAKKLNSAMINAYRRNINNEPINTLTNNWGRNNEVSIDYIYDLLAESMVVTPRIKVDKTYIYGEWEPISYVGPLVEVKWNQGYPFNMKMDYVTWNGYTAQMSVGCTVIAAAQMMSSNRHPMSAPGDSATYPWNNLKLVSNYLNMKNYFPYYPDALPLPEKSEYVDQLADVLHHIGKCFNVFFHEGGTGATIEDVLAGLKSLDPVYYKDAKWVTIKDNMDKIYKLLNASKPVYIRGSNMGNSSGHAWIIDGYLNCERDVVITETSGYNPPVTYTRREQGTMLHCNWGWQGTGDGYFLPGIFNVSKREFVDEIIDCNISQSLVMVNYGYSNEIIIY